MGSPLEICRKRGVVAVLASGVVISLTALTGGIAPAFAKPDDEQPVVPSTTFVVPAPEVTAPEPEEVAPAPEPDVVAPEPAAPRPAPAVEEAPKVQAPKVQAPPQTQEPAPAPIVAPEPEPVAEPEPEQQSQAPAAPARPPVTSVEPAAPSAPAAPSEETATSKPEPSTARRAPVTESDAPTATSPAETPAEAGDVPQPSGTAVPPSEALAPATADENAPSSATEKPTSGSATEESEATTEAEDSSGSESATPQGPEAARVLKTAQPETLQADKRDIEVAKTAKVIEEKPAPAAAKDVDDFASSVNLSLGLGGRDGIKAGANADFRVGVDRDRDWEWGRKVRQWRPDWVEYDQFYRPILMNPFRAPVRIVYIYDFAPRIVYIPPLARIVLDVARYAAYSFTALVLNPINTAIDLAQDVVQTAANIAVGSFFGGGFVPRFGLPLPPPPPRVLRYDNVPVLVRYPQQTYEPFRVRRIVDVGDDAQYGERKVLLDGVTPAWGQWTQTATGERQFEVHKTQQFPGLDAPAHGPLPGDYPLRLAADESSTAGLSGRDVFLYVAAGVVGTLGFAALGGAFFLGRRRLEH
ncbi:hypothetical protein [Mycobacterium deserti]|uniref:Uncharacterized protein n=1 Tax=Mycobacterium deserti TaxID=2978347 RepID=A0ABT2MDI0_9MYCO|nr:hypothetical protein [Mycobacterium deserti]MCT7660313.1 hypothetical protein [Mycobacterium deserti]